MQDRVQPTGKQPVNNLSLDTLETLLAEEMEVQDLYDCKVNWICLQNTQ